ncbi:dihydrodipicolinate reductase C-terminal domain-containing protein [Granulicella sp. dw_53]|uniref:4-hydroxy-tetrahydrodipicolinate reductase n=1 Tax=Granulicella sp. dw_53 TaxID=2719792 RepID=UPI001BD2EBB5|nr:dihydrodipicolinate reductase C-terminal domain-containing protein [Granulicella sp. dw_53]
MRILVLGHGKTGKLVAQVAAERSHSVHVLDAKENPDAMALTPPFVAGFDVVIDFTAPEAVVQNMRACLATGAKMVVGTTGWYEKLPDMRGLAERKQAGLLYGTNFSIGVQVMLQLATKMGELLKDAGYAFTIDETHHVSKVDSPSGTALTLAQAVKSGGGIGDVPITSHREGDATGTHVLAAKSEADRLVLTHESYSRRGFAEGAVRAAEWLSTRTGCYDFQDVYTKI